MVIQKILHFKKKLYVNFVREVVQKMVKCRFVRHAKEVVFDYKMLISVLDICKCRLPVIDAVERGKLQLEIAQLVLDKRFFFLLLLLFFWNNYLGCSLNKNIKNRYRKRDERWIINSFQRWKWIKSRLLTRWCNFYFKVG